MEVGTGPVAPQEAKRVMGYTKKLLDFAALQGFNSAPEWMAVLIANDRPFLIKFDGHLYFPAFVSYPETAFGGIFATSRRSSTRILSREYACA